jgi:hypothetical protein
MSELSEKLSIPIPSGFMEQFISIIDKPFEILLVRKVDGSKTLKQEIVKCTIRKCITDMSEYKYDGGDYHKESLLLHSFLTMFNFLNSGYNEVPILLGAIACLLHDIGKIEAHETIYIDNEPHVANYFHAELSAAFMLSMSSIMAPKEQWEIVCRAVSIHMTRLDNESNVKILGLENLKVKKFFEVLRNCDNLSRFPKGETIPVPVKELQMEPRGGLILMRGGSSSGKTVIAKEIQKNIPESVIVERDQAMFDVAKMHNFSFSDVIEDYPRVYKYTKEYHLSREINDLVKERIQQAFVEGKVVILDTMATSYGNSVGTLIPEYAVNYYFTVVVDIVRQVEITENDISRKKFDEPMQLKLLGERNSIYSSISAEIQSYRNYMSRAERKNSSGPHMVFEIVNNFNKIDELPGFSTMISIVRQLKGFPLPSEMKNIKDISLVDLVKFLVKTEGIDINSFFHEYDVDVRRIEDDIYIFSYREGCKYWYRFVRESRGTVLYIPKNSKEIQMLKGILPRGSEISPFGKSFDPGVLDDDQEESKKLLTTGEPFEGYLSMKSDGCLLSVGFYPEGAKQDIILKILRNAVDPVKKMYLETYEKGHTGKVLVILSSRGTLLLDEKGIVPFTRAINTIVRRNDSDNGMYIGLMSSFIDMVYERWSLLGINRESSLAFEAISANRQDFSGEFHKELAVCYPNNMLKFLGVNVGYSDNCINFIPHFMFSKMQGFDTPKVWKVNNAAEVKKIFDRMQEMIDEEYNNSFVYHRGAIDPEGFVFYRYVNGHWTLSKIKTNEYYMGHMFKVENVQTILDSPTNNDNIFPMFAEVRKFFGNLPSDFYKCLQVCKKEIDKFTRKHELDTLPAFNDLGHNKFENLLMSKKYVDNVASGMWDREIVPFIRENIHSVVTSYFHYIPIDGMFGDISWTQLMNIYWDDTLEDIQRKFRGGYSSKNPAMLFFAKFFKP